MALGATVGPAPVVAVVVAVVGCQTRMLYRHALMLCVEVDTFIEEISFLYFPG